MRIWWRQFLNDTPSLFKRVENAFTATLTLLILAVILYAVIHWVQPSDQPDWNQAVTLSDELLFKPQFCQWVLERYVSPADMTEFKKGISDRCEEMARVAIRKRQITLGQIAALAQGELDDQTLPFILQKTSDQKTEADYRFTSLTNLSLWLQTQPIAV